MSLMVRLLAFVQDRRAATAVEFALIALPFLMLIVGSLEMSRFVWTRHAVQDAAASGARCLGLRRPPCFSEGRASQSGTTDFVRDRAEGWMILVAADAVTVEESAECSDVPGFSRIAIRHDFVSVFSPLTGASIEVDACFPSMASG